jgi:ubiquinone/menaquinone biosynthesis C-methylase UbiE
MNEAHLRLLASPEWARTLREELLPWLTQAGELGDDVLELGPGPGLTTDLLMRRTAQVTAVEVDEQLAQALARRMAGTNVTVIRGDASATGLPADRFSAVVCFSMLHHVPSASLQDQVLHEAFRVLRPGYRFLAVDAVDCEALRELHVDDTFVPFDPGTAAGRLATAGFRDITIEHAGQRIRVTGRKD